MKPLTLSKGSALIVVAHPDDETIWMGGTILAHPHIDWHIISLCRGNDPDRTPRFRRVLKAYGAEGAISDLEDDGALTIRASIPEIERRLHTLVPRRRFDFAFTHGYNGEYGHPRHRGVNRVMRALLRAKTIVAARAFAFAYQWNERETYAVAEQDATYQNTLSHQVYAKKKRIIGELYGFRASTFEVKSARAKESFSLLT